MGYKRKTWQQKLEDGKNLPKTLELEPTFPCYRALKKMRAEPGDSVVLAPGLGECLKRGQAHILYGKKRHRGSFG